MATQLPDYLVDTLEELGYAEAEGLVTSESDLRPGARDYIWDDLKAKVGLEAAFFSDGVPLVGFTSEEHPVGLRAIRERLWNYGRVPILIASGKTSVQAFNAVSFSNAETASGLLVESRFDLESDRIVTDLNKTEVESGSFAKRFSSIYSRSTRVDAALLNNLQYLRRGIAKTSKPTREALDALLGACLTATYLVQRSIVLPEYLEAITGYNNLGLILDDGREPCRRLFSALAQEFNGDVFGPVSDMISVVDERIIQQIGALLNGDDLATGQRSLWPYDFSVLPSDLVSSIYEQLLEDTRHVDSAYYTPRFLVNVLLDEILPWTETNLPRVIDLACGSGAFMTEAFRRLCYRERKRQGRDLTYEELRAVLQAKIFGIDKNPVAARTAIFGLYLALLEQLKSRTVWDGAVLPTLLNRNVMAADAFDRHGLSTERFDCVVGNPPWRSHHLPANAQRFLRENDLPAPDKQYAAAFFWLAQHMLTASGSLGLIMPSGLLLHNRGNRAEAFKSAAFNALDVDAIVDLSALRRQLFKNAVGPAAMVVARRRRPPGEADTAESEMLYVAPHPRSVGSTVDALTITPEEVKSISKSLARARSDIWKPLLWGSRHDLDLLDRMRGMYGPLSALSKERGWFSSQGYQIGGGANNDARHLMGMPIIETSMLGRGRLLLGERKVFRHETLHRERKVELYRAPHVLLSRTVRQNAIVGALVSEDAVFADGIVGIAGSESDKVMLGAVAAISVSDIARYWHFMTSSMWGVERDAIAMGELMTLPVPSLTETEAVRLYELANAFGPEDKVTAAVNRMVMGLYKLSKDEMARISNFTAVDLPRFTHPRTAFSNAADDSWIEAYCEVICDTLEGAIDGFRFNGFFRCDYSYCTAGITVQPAGESVDARAKILGEVDIIDPARVLAASRRNTRYGTSVYAQPAGFFLDGTTIFIVKTTDRDRWSRDAALSDAERVFTTLAFRNV